MANLDHTALGTWSGGRFMHFGEPLDDERLAALLRPDDKIRTVITADAYGAGEADALLGRALAGLDRERYTLVGAIGHDFYTGEREGAKGFPRFTDPRLRGTDGYADYVRMATERSLERVGVDRFDLLLLHNPDRIGYTSPVVWDALRAVRDEGLAGAIGVAPGPANGFTLDLIDCFERFGELIEWAMVILNPLEPWPGELVLPAAREHGVKLITRVVDYGGLFWDDVLPGHEFAPRDHRGFRPAGWVEGGREGRGGGGPARGGGGGFPPPGPRPAWRLPLLPCQWNLAHEPVRCVAPTLIQEPSEAARTIEEKRAELAAVPAEGVLSDVDVAEIRAIGDNTGCMALKGASPQFSGEPQPDRWPLDGELAQLAERWAIDPQRDLAQAAA